jgi:RNA polymerase primary sigma factor
MAEPLPENLAREMDISEDKVGDYQDAHEPRSHEPRSAKNRTALGLFYPEPTMRRLQRRPRRSHAQEQLMDDLDTLTPREEKVLRLRFGWTTDAQGPGKVGKIHGDP